MRRRAFLAGTVCCAATAGCVSVLDDDDRHPFADATVTVRVDEDSDTEHDLQENARRALEFWETNSPAYAGFDITFELTDEENPDIVIAYADTAAGCENVPGFSERVLGCAPILRAGTRVPEPTVARVVAGARPFGKVLITTKHELGHILGLGHDDEPREIMSNRPADRIPLYQDRIDIWEGVVGAQERVTEAGVSYQSGIEYWNDRDFAAAKPLFESASDAFSTAASEFEELLDMTAVFEGHPQVETVDLDEVKRLLTHLASRTETVGRAATRMAEAAEAAIAGETETASTRQREANDAIAEFRDLGPVQVRNVAIALGLVRGFDRDETVVDVDDEAVSDGE